MKKRKAAKTGRRKPLSLQRLLERLRGWGSALSGAREPRFDGSDGVLRGSLAGAGLILGGFGQAFFARHTAGTPFLLGLLCYLVAVALFMAGLWGFSRERLSRLPLSPRVEWGFFAAILALAAFLRVVNLETIPSGIFIDEGFMGWAPLHILHDGWRPLLIKDPMFIDAMVVYQTVPWFIFMPNTQWSLYLYYAVMALAAFPLIYWTFRQLAGPRVALLTLYILAVMRWHLNFSRNGFISILVPLYMFGTLAFLLHGLKTRKTWPFVVSACFFGTGLYTYNAYKAFLLLLPLLGLYELLADPERLRRNRKNLMWFAVISAVLIAPELAVWANRDVGESRETQLLVFNRCRQEGSLMPLVKNVATTALIWNYTGDNNARHAYKSGRMLDDVSGVLFVLGFFYALFRLWRRKYFWGVAGLLVMSLPCVLSVDALHANRMLGTTPFTAFVTAAAVAALWGRIRALAGAFGEFLLLMVLSVFLVWMGAQNASVYFLQQANDYITFREYAAEATHIGKEMARHRDRYEYFTTRDFHENYTVRYLMFYQRQHLHELKLPQGVAPATVPEGRGLFVALEKDRTGIFGWLQRLYPGGEATTPLDPKGIPLARYFRVEASDVDAARGLTARLPGRDRPVQLRDFPRGLPPGSGFTEFKGVLVVPQTGRYRFDWKGSGALRLSVGAWEPVRGEERKLVRGLYPLRIGWERPAGAEEPGLMMLRVGEPPAALDASSVAILPKPRGLRARFHIGMDLAKPPDFESWEPVVNFTNGNDLPTQKVPISARFTGTLTVPESGEYTFFGDTLYAEEQDLGSVKIDGRTVVRPGPDAKGKVHLQAGTPYALEVLYQKPHGYGAMFSLLWLRPGRTEFEVVPNDVFGFVE